MSKPSTDKLNTPLSLASVSEEGPWNDAQLAAFVVRPGEGRVLCIGGETAHTVETQLNEAQYEVGYLDQEQEGEELIAAAASFLPDLIYLAMEQDLQHGLDALEALSTDSRTKNVPLLALLPKDADAQVIQEAFSRTACDFFRLGQTRVELLARTHLLVRLSKSKQADASTRSPGYKSKSSFNANAANQPANGRVDLKDDATELFSVGYFFHRLPTEVSRARRYKRALSLLALRCPDAKHNEATADRLATVLKKHLRDCDISARLEADLFVSLLPETSSDRLEALEARIERDFDRANLKVYRGRAGLDRQGKGCSPQEMVDRARSLADNHLGLADE